MSRKRHVSTYLNTSSSVTHTVIPTLNAFTFRSARKRQTKRRTEDIVGRQIDLRAPMTAVEVIAEVQITRG